MTINLKPTDQGPHIHTDIPKEWGEEIRPLNIYQYFQTLLNYLYRPI